MFGWIIPDPLAHPPTVTVFEPIVSRAELSFLTRSVVMMASAAKTPPPRLIAVERFFMPRSIFLMGSGWPMTPVEATSMRRGEQPRALAVAWAMRIASFKPFLVSVLEFPEFMTIPRAKEERKWARVTVTGAPFTLFTVKAPHAAAGRSDTMRARSLLLSFFTPQASPPALKPSGAVTPLLPAIAPLF
jgi:hypothetical protein